MRLPRLRPLTLTARLVAVAVLLVAVTAAVIGTATTLAMRENLDRRLDQDVRATLARALDVSGSPRPPTDIAEHRVRVLSQSARVELAGPHRAGFARRGDDGTVGVDQRGPYRRGAGVDRADEVRHASSLVSSGNSGRVQLRANSTGGPASA